MANIIKKIITILIAFAFIAEGANPGYALRPMASAKSSGMFFIEKLHREFHCEGLGHLRNPDVIEKGWSPAWVYRFLKTLRTEQDIYQAALEPVCREHIDRDESDDVGSLIRDVLSFGKIILFAEESVAPINYMPEHDILAINLLAYSVQEFINYADDIFFHELTHSLTYDEIEALDEVRSGKRGEFVPEEIIPFSCGRLYFYDISSLYYEKYGKEQLSEAEREEPYEFHMNLYRAETDVLAFKLTEELRPGTTRRALSIMIKNLKPLKITGDLVWAALYETLALQVGHKEAVSKYNRLVKEFLSTMPEKKEAEALKKIYKIMKERFTRQYKSIKVDDAFRQAYQEARDEILDTQQVVVSTDDTRNKFYLISGGFPSLQFLYDKLPPIFKEKVAAHEAPKLPFVVCEKISPEKEQKILAYFREHIHKAKQAGAIPILIGGSHILSYWFYIALKEVYEIEADIVSLDMDSDTMGYELDECCFWNYGIIKGTINPEKLTVVGIGVPSHEPGKWAHKQGVTFCKDNLPEGREYKDVFISLDIDVYERLGFKKLFNIAGKLGGGNILGLHIGNAYELWVDGLGGSELNFIKALFPHAFEDTVAVERPQPIEAAKKQMLINQAA